jgi:hypothetical protein
MEELKRVTVMLLAVVQNLKTYAKVIELLRGGMLYWLLMLSEKIYIPGLDCFSDGDRTKGSADTGLGSAYFN